MWSYFEKYHYLSHSLSTSSKCFCLEFNGKIIGFIAITKFMHPIVRNMHKVHRLVILPEYQGLGLGIKFMEEIGKIYLNQKMRFTITTGLKSLCLALRKKDNWKCIHFGRVSSGSGSCLIHNNKIQKSTSHDRITGSFEMIK